MERRGILEFSKFMLEVETPFSLFFNIKSDPLKFKERDSELTEANIQTEIPINTYTHKYIYIISSK